MAGKSIAEWLIRRVEFRVEEQSWPLIITHRALLLCESLTGVDMLGADLQDPSASLLRALLFAALSVAGATCSIEYVGSRITRSTLSEIQETVGSAWIASMPEPEAVPEPEPG